MKGSCTALVVGPIVGLLCLLAAAYMFWKRSKSGNATVGSTDNMGKSSTSMWLSVWVPFGPLHSKPSKFVAQLCFTQIADSVTAQMYSVSNNFAYEITFEKEISRLLFVWTIEIIKFRRFHIEREKNLFLPLFSLLK